MKNISIYFCVAVLSLMASTTTLADSQSFSDGPVIKNYGKHASVTQDFSVEAPAIIRHAFDVGNPSTEGQVNRPSAIAT